jgi:hypothetical protein
MNDLDHIVMLPVMFIDGLRQHIELIESQLHPSTPIVLGLPWLQQANPQISWAKMEIKHMGYHPDLMTTPLSVDTDAATASTSDLTPSTHTIIIEAYKAQDFIKETSEDGAMLFACMLADPIHVHATSVVCEVPPTPMLPDSIPENEHQVLATQLPAEYHEFHNVFTGTVNSYLLLHHTYDLKFNIEEGRQVP